MKYYLLHTVEDVWPELHGPYVNVEDRDNKALELRAEMGDPKDGLYRLDISSDGTPTTEPYSGDFFPDEQ